MALGEALPPVDGVVPWLSQDEHLTWLALHQLLARLPSKLDRQLREDSALSFVEYYVLVLISDQVDHTIRMSRLAFLANSELSRLSHLVTRLERRGLVCRQPDPTDGRYTNAILTDAGLEYIQQAAPGHVRAVRRLVFDVLDGNEQHAMRNALRKILANLNG